jgi:folate-binding protein YgfZ
VRGLPLDEQVAALDAGRASVVLTDHVATRVYGSDARGWLNDLVTTDVETLEPGRSRPSLLLTPTGRIRALVHILCAAPSAFVLLQRNDQPEPIERLLAPYVLSSDVTIASTSERFVASPGAAPPSDDAFVPSVLGGGGHDRPFDAMTATTPTVPNDAAEARRIARGQPRFGVDLDADSFPAEASLDVAPVTDRGKGCFLGQEAVAKIANLGHPARLVLAVTTDGGSLRAGEEVLAAGEPVGAITSASGAHGLVRIRWGTASDRLTSATGTPLRASPPLAEPV